MAANHELGERLRKRLLAVELTLQSEVYAMPEGEAWVVRAPRQMHSPDDLAAIVRAAGLMPTESFEGRKAGIPYVYCIFVEVATEVSK